MKKFKFIGNPLHYSGDFNFGEVYKSSFIGIHGAEANMSVKDLVSEYPNDWEKIVEEKTSKEELIDKMKKQPLVFVPTLHKDTDLGYFAGLAMHGLLSNQAMIDNLDEHSIDWLKKTSVSIAQELIKKLDEYES